MTHKPIITAAQLRRAGACPEQLDLFVTLFGDEVEVTMEAAEKFSGNFDWDWAAVNLLSQSGRDEYQKATAPLWAEYEKATAPLWNEYEKARAPLWAEYEKATAPLWAEYEKATARTFATIYIREASQ